MLVLNNFSLTVYKHHTIQLCCCFFNYVPLYYFFLRKRTFFQGETSGNYIDLGSTSDLELDAQLESLRKKLAEVITNKSVECRLLKLKSLHFVDSEIVTYFVFHLIYLVNKCAVRWGKSLKC